MGSSNHAVEDYGFVPETLCAATRFDGRLRSDHAVNCVGIVLLWLMPA